MSFEVRPVVLEGDYVRLEPLGEQHAGGLFPQRGRHRPPPVPPRGHRGRVRFNPLLSRAMSVRTRFAPSPTGFLHVGSARTALFNWAFARRHGGAMVLRIEDTDRERSTRESEQGIVDGLRWLGIDWDEGPLRQSERRAGHVEAIERLLARGRAYRCRCTPEQLEERKRATIARGDKWTYDGRCRDLGLGSDCGPHTVRLRLPEEGQLAWDDGVFGASGQDAREIGDRIIRRSDGDPLYHLAVVVDDLDMQISHVIRGADHHANTPFQIAIYQALECEPPHFAHVPLIVGPGGKKLSKRKDPVSVEQFRDEGYLPAAVANRLAGRLEAGGEGTVCLILMLKESRQEVEVQLPGQYRVTPQIAGAIKAVPGIVHVETSR